MLRGSAAFEETVLGSHEASVRAEAWVGLQKVASLDCVSGSISIDSSSFVRRTASLVFADTETARAALTEPGMQVRVWRGAQRTGATSWLPVHWGQVATVSRDRYGASISVSSPDLSWLCSAARFVQPRNSDTTLTVVQQIQELVREAIPWVSWEIETGDMTPVSAVTWDRDRNTAITQLADSIGCEAFLRPDGAFCIRQRRTLSHRADLRVEDGVNLVSAKLDIDLGKIRNVVVATADRADADAPDIWAVAQDDDNESPTWVGRIGQNVGFFESSLITSQQQALKAAVAQLLRQSGQPVDLAYSGVLHPGMEAGDRHDVRTEGRIHRVVADSLTWDLFGSTVSGSARSASKPVPADLS